MEPNLQKFQTLINFIDEGNSDGCRHTLLTCPRLVHFVAVATTSIKNAPSVTALYHAVKYKALDEVIKLLLSCDSDPGFATEVTYFAPTECFPTFFLFLAARMV